MTPEEVYREIVDYERLHPWAVRIVPLLGFRLDGSDAARRLRQFRGWWPSDLGRDHRTVGVLRRRVRGGPPQAGVEHGVTRSFSLPEKDAGLLVS